MRAVVLAGAAVLGLTPMMAGAQATVVGSPTVGAEAGINYDAVTGAEQSWGQTFRTLSSSAVQLDSWVFWLNALQSPEVTLDLQIAVWNGTGLAGSPIYTSAAFTPSVSSTPQKVFFAIGQILDPTLTYIAFLNPVGVSGGGTSGASFVGYNCPACAGSPSYTDGDLILLTSTTGNDLASNPNALNFGPYDSQFKATFSTVVATPEPASLALMATGLLGVAGFVRKRRQGSQV